MTCDCEPGKHMCGKGVTIGIHSPCWICGKPGVNRTRVEIGCRETMFRRGVPVRFSPWIDFCDSNHCLLEFADFAEAVAKDFRRTVKNRRQKESRRANRG